MGIAFSRYKPSFWNYWIDRFEDNYDKYITPQSEVVAKECNSIEVPNGAGDFEIAREVWLTMYDRIEYNLTKEWSEPEETIKAGHGDCEDVSFLCASMLPNLGVSKAKLSVGNLVKNDGRVEEHVWNEVDGRVVDLTGTPDVVQNLEYEEIKSWTIQAD